MMAPFAIMLLILLIKPTGLDVDAAGNLYISGSAPANRVRRVTPAIGGVITTLAGIDLILPTNITATDGTIAFQRFTGGQIYGRMFSKSPSAKEASAAAHDSLPACLPNAELSTCLRCAQIRQSVSPCAWLSSGTTRAATDQ